LQIPSEAAQHRTEREQSETGHEEGFAAEHPSQKAAGRQDDGVGNQISGDHPGRFVLAHPHAAGNVGERDVGDGGVEHLHEARERNHEGD
jgi:hypothetical protein